MAKQVTTETRNTVIAVTHCSNGRPDRRAILRSYLETTTDDETGAVTVREWDSGQVLLEECEIDHLGATSWRPEDRNADPLILAASRKAGR